MRIGHSQADAQGDGRGRDRGSLVVAFVVYAAIVIWITWPLASQITTHLAVPQPRLLFDTLFTTWSLAWTSHTLSSAPSNLLNANTYYPAEHALLYGPTAFGALPNFAPAFLLTGNPALAINLTLLGGIALTAWTLHFVVVRWTASHLGGLAAASTFLATPWVWHWVPTVPFYAVLQYLPLIVLFAAKPRHSIGTALALVTLVTVQCLVDPLNLSAAILTTLGLTALYRLSRRDTRSAGLHAIAILGVSAIVMLPVYYGYLSVAASNPDLKHQTLWAFAAPYNPLLANYVHWIGDLMYIKTQLSWRLLRPAGPTNIPIAAWLAILLGALSVGTTLWRGGFVQARRGWTHAAYWAAMGMLLSMQPVIVAFDHTIWLPHILFSVVPSVRVVWHRLGVIGLIGLSLLAGIALSECAARIGVGGRWRRLCGLARLSLAAALVGAMFAQRFHDAPPYPTLEAAALRGGSSVVHELRQSRGPLLELPLDERDSKKALPHAAAMYRSIFHWRPLLNGYSSYWPAGFAERMAVAERLPEPDALEDLRGETGLAAILVNTRWCRPNRCAAWLGLAQRGGRDDLRLVLRDRDVLLFAVSAGTDSEMPD